MSMPMDVTSLGAVTAADAGAARVVSNELNSDHFLQLLVTQLQNQDPLNPLSNEDFLAQLAQFQSLQEQIEMSANVKSLLLGQQLAAASGLIGKDVVVIGADGFDYVGRVDKVAVEDGEVMLVVGDTVVGLDEIKEVRIPPDSGI